MRKESPKPKIIEEKAVQTTGSAPEVDSVDTNRPRELAEIKTCITMLLDFSNTYFQHELQFLKDKILDLMNQKISPDQFIQIIQDRFHIKFAPSFPSLLRKRLPHMIEEISELGDFLSWSRCAGTLGIPPERHLPIEYERLPFRRMPRNPYWRGPSMIDRHQSFDDIRHNLNFPGASSQNEPFQYPQYRGLYDGFRFGGGTRSAEQLNYEPAIYGESLKERDEAKRVKMQESKNPKEPNIPQQPVIEEKDIPTTKHSSTLESEEPKTSDTPKKRMHTIENIFFKKDKA